MKKIKIGGIYLWHRPWFTEKLEEKVKIVAPTTELDGEKTWLGEFASHKKYAFDGLNMFKESELYPLDEGIQLNLFSD